MRKTRETLRLVANKSTNIYVDRMMGRWESLIDKKIREAMEQGEFDNLPGKGEPIDLSENPFEDPDWRTAHRLLKNAGFAPAWIEEGKEIQGDLELARIKLARAWLILQNAGGSKYQKTAQVRWERNLISFRQQTADLNRRILAWNVKTPAPIFHRSLINAEKEIEEIKRSGSGYMTKR